MSLSEIILVHLFFPPHWKVRRAKAGSWPCAIARTAPGSCNIHAAFSFACRGPLLGQCSRPWEAPLPASYLSPLPPRHEAQRLEQEARGRLERQKILDQSEAEKARRELLELEALRWGGELAEKMAEGLGRAPDRAECMCACVFTHAAIAQVKGRGGCGWASSGASLTSLHCPQHRGGEHRDRQGGGRVPS